MPAASRPQFSPKSHSPCIEWIEGPQFVRAGDKCGRGCSTGTELYLCPAGKLLFSGSASPRRLPLQAHRQAPLCITTLEGRRGRLVSREGRVGGRVGIRRRRIANLPWKRQIVDIPPYARATYSRGQPRGHPHRARGARPCANCVEQSSLTDCPPIKLKTVESQEGFLDVRRHRAPETLGDPHAAPHMNWQRGKGGRLH